jgi:hypothetical protein
MIDLKDQQYLYDLLLTHLELNPNDISLPKLVVDETDCELDLEHIHPWFDTLGWFSSASPGEVTLAPRCIELVAQKLHCLPLHLACLVYVHEVAHYLHFAQNRRGFLDYTPKEERTTYVESFAQLCTHAVARFFDSLGYGHLKIFDDLCKGQPDEYNYFQRNKLNLMERTVIVDYFLHPNAGGLPELSHLFEIHEEHILSLIRTKATKRAEMIIEQLHLGFSDIKDHVEHRFENIYFNLNHHKNMLEQKQYHELWANTLAQPIFNLPSYYQYLQREIYFQDYLDLFGYRDRPTFARLPGNLVDLTGHVELVSDPAGIYTDNINGKVYLKVEYDFPFRDYLNKGRLIRNVMIGEAAPAPAATIINYQGKQINNTFVYNVLHIGQTPYFSEPLQAFGINRTHKIKELVALADKGYVLLDLLPFAISYSTNIREILLYGPFWDLLCNKIYVYGNLKLADPQGVKFGFAGPATLHHRIVLNLIEGGIKLPVHANTQDYYTADLRLNELHGEKGEALPPSNSRGSIQKWIGLMDNKYFVNGNFNWVIQPSQKHHVNLPMYACESWDASFMGPNRLFIKVAFDLP